MEEELLVRVGRSDSSGEFCVKDGFWKCVEEGLGGERGNDSSNLLRRGDAAQYSNVLKTLANMS